MKKSKARWYQDLSDIQRYCIAVDLKATKKAGFMNDSVKVMCADSIEKEARDYFEKSKMKHT
jgi:hypothetical protein